MNHFFTKNYHTHTYRCKHAKGDIEDYISYALSGHLKVLGFSDHTPLPDEKWARVRMKLNELDDYIAKIDNAKQKYPQLKILKALECEYAPEYENYYKELKEKYELDYFIGGGHFYPHESRWKDVYGDITTKKDLFAYTDYIIKSIQVPYFLFVAHPDLFGNCYLPWDKNTISCSKAILKAAAEYNMPLEINGYGLRKPQIKTSQGLRCMYPLTPFWELASNYPIKVVLSSDAHRPQDVAASLKDCYKIAQANNLEIAEFNF